jgi:hypothetical protein
MTDFENRLADALALAALVREAQDEYFHTRRQSSDGEQVIKKLVAAKQAEKKFDAVCGPILAEARSRGWAPS